MKELVRFVSYSTATAVIILFVIFMARYDDESGTLLVIIGVLAVIVLPVLVGVFMGHREQVRRQRESVNKGE